MNHLELKSLSLAALGLVLAPSMVACVQVDADLPPTCFVQPDVSIAAVEVGGITAQDVLDAAQGAGLDLPDTLPPVAVEQSFTRDGLSDLPAALDELGAEATLGLMHVDVIAKSGLSSFSGIERVVITMVPTDPSSDLGPTVLARCDRAEGCDVSGSMVTLSGDPGVDLIPYMRAGELEFTLELAGSAPLQTWTFDVDVCMQGDASMNLQLL